MQVWGTLRKAFWLYVVCPPLIALSDPLQFNMLPGVTPISRDVYALHMAVFWICVAIAIVVFGVLIYTLIHHRQSKGHSPAKFYHSTRVEIIWAVVPLLILIAMAVPATVVMLRMDDDAKADINIKVVGYQWKWQYDYLDQGISYFSNLSTPQTQLDNQEQKGQWYLLEVDKPLVVPIHQKIRFLVTANDVIHSWWVPALGIKRDAIPGFIHEAWARIEKPGVYRGQCAELCGLRHAYMPIVVKAVTQDEFKQWIKDQKRPEAPPASPPTTKAQAKGQEAAPPTIATRAALMEKGKQVYTTTCQVCHQATGAGMPPAFPELKGNAMVTGPVKPVIHIVLHGKQGTAMQAFKTQLTDAELAAVITYIRNAWGNEAGDTVQSADVASARDDE